MSEDEVLDGIIDELGVHIKDCGSVVTALSERKTDVIKLAELGIPILEKQLTQDCMSTTEARVLKYQLAMLYIYAWKPFRASRLIKELNKDREAWYMKDDIKLLAGQVKFEMQSLGSHP